MGLGGEREGDGGKERNRERQKDRQSETDGQRSLSIFLDFCFQVDYGS